MTPRNCGWSSPTTNDPRAAFSSALLKDCGGVQVCGEAASGEEAIGLIERVRPHLALLDLQMPEVGGLDVVRRLPADRLPLVAFVTAFDDFAIEAFEVNAIDYVLKPAERTRVQATLDRARQRLQRSRTRRGFARPPWRARPRPTNRARGVRTWSACRCDGATRSSFCPYRQIAFVESEGELLHITTVAERTLHPHPSAARARGPPGPSTLRPPGPRHARQSRPDRARQPDAGRYLHRHPVERPSACRSAASSRASFETRSSSCDGVKDARTHQH